MTAGNFDLDLGLGFGSGRNKCVRMGPRGVVISTNVVGWIRIGGFQMGVVAYIA